MSFNTTATLLLFLVLTGCSSTQRLPQPLKDVRELSLDKYKGRKAGTAENKLAAEYIITRFKEIGLKPYGDDFKNQFTYSASGGKTINATNLISYIKGVKPDVIVISAHYDHVGVINGEIYNGADDNASGVGGLLALAKYFAENPPEHSLIFAAFDAEEDGLRGAKAFVASPNVPLASIKLNVNLDMIGRSERNELYVAGTYHYPFLKQNIIITNSKIKLLTGHDDPALGRKNDWTNQSDQAAFHAAKIPFLYFGVEDHEDYHRPTDDFKRIHTEFYANAISVILEVLQSIDKGITIKQTFKDKLIMKE